MAAAKAMAVVVAMVVVPGPATTTPTGAAIPAARAAEGTVRTADQVRRAALLLDLERRHAGRRRRRRIVRV